MWVVWGFGYFPSRGLLETADPRVYPKPSNPEPFFVWGSWLGGRGGGGSEVFGLKFCSSGSATGRCGDCSMHV